MSSGKSLLWGIATSLLAGIGATIISTPLGLTDTFVPSFIAILFAFLIYNYYLKDKGIKLLYFIIGYFFMFFIVLTLIVAILGTAIIGFGGLLV